jgi:hypothetical protein
LILSRYTAAPLELYFTRGSVSFGTPYCCATHTTNLRSALRVTGGGAGVGANAPK